MFLIFLSAWTFLQKPNHKVNRVYGFIVNFILYKTPVSFEKNLSTFRFYVNNLYYLVSLTHDTAPLLDRGCGI